MKHLVHVLQQVGKPTRVFRRPRRHPRAGAALRRPRARPLLPGQRGELLLDPPRSASAESAKTFYAGPVAQLRRRPHLAGPGGGFCSSRTSRSWTTITSSGRSTRATTASRAPATGCDLVNRLESEAVAFTKQVDLEITKRFGPRPTRCATSAAGPARRRIRRLHASSPPSTSWAATQAKPRWACGTWSRCRTAATS